MEKYNQEDPNVALLNELDLAIEGEWLAESDPLNAESRARSLMRQHEAVHDYEGEKIKKLEVAIRKNQEGLTRLESIKKRIAELPERPPELEAKYDEALKKISNDLKENQQSLERHIQDVDKEDLLAKSAMKNPHVAQAMYKEALKEDEERSKQ